MVPITACPKRYISVPLNEKPEEELEPIAMIGVPALFSNHQPDPVPCAVIPDLKMDPLAMFRVPVIPSVPSVPLVAVMSPVILALVAVAWLLYSRRIGLLRTPGAVPAADDRAAPRSVRDRVDAFFAGLRAPRTVVVVVVAALLLSYPWHVLAAGAILYLAALPFGQDGAAFLQHGPVVPGAGREAAGHHVQHDVGQQLVVAEHLLEGLARQVGPVMEALQDPGGLAHRIDRKSVV